MKLKATSGAEFHMVILGYQHPDVHEDRWDSNWLLVNGEVTDDTGARWRFSAPCVTAFELSDLADWMKELASGGREPSTFEFAEPNLTFSYTPWPRELQLVLKADSAPPEAGESVRQAGVTLNFPLSELSLEDTAEQIRDVLIDYPIRGGAA